MADFAKKLTVSFGAFSCTLSGFDDPFPVMRQVVDYFQALSKSDPSFGAHPERPDTEALRVLAEQTSGLAVGAEMQGDEVILSSVEDNFDQASGDDTFEAMSAQVSQDLNAPSEPVDPIEQPSPEEISSLISKEMAAAESVENEPTAPAPSGQTDSYEHLQIDDLDDEAFVNINAEDIFDSVQNENQNTPVQEDMTGYLNEAVQFTDVENPALDQNWEAPSQDTLDETSLAEKAELEDDQIASEPVDLIDPVPVWENELVSDEPIEEIAEILPMTMAEDATDADSLTSNPDDEPLTYDDHLKAEQTALSNILAATGTPDAAQVPDEPDVDDKDLPDPEEIRNTAKSLVLGFGAAASLDATGEVTTATLDTRPDRSAEALRAMGMYEEETDDFGWSADDDAPVEPAKAEPLLLTPMQKVSSAEDDIEVLADPLPTPAIDLEQDDPRPDLRRFADAAGAASMTELLEASAAYSTLVSGRPNFSRREVLDLLDAFSDSDGFSQETQIKTFGSLLRGGRIQSIGNGDYEMTNDALSDYQTTKRAG